MDDMGTVVAAQNKYKGNFPGPAPVLMLSRETSADAVDAASAAGSHKLRAPCASGLLVPAPSCATRIPVHAAADLARACRRRGSVAVSSAGRGHALLLHLVLR